MSNIPLRAVFLAVLVTTVRPIDATCATTPFDGTDWTQTLARDPTLHVNREMQTASGTFYSAKDGGGIFSADDSADVVVGRAGDEWIAAVPLDSGGSIGRNGWLLYLRGRSAHIAFIGGSESLRFAGDKIVTVTERGGRVEGHGVEHTFSVSGTTVKPSGARNVSLAAPVVTKFASADWSQLPANDPDLHGDASTDLSREYVATSGKKGIFDPKKINDVVVAVVGAQAVAAVPLAETGSPDRWWLIYVPGKQKHIGSIGAAEHLRIINNEIVTTSHDRAGQIEDTYVINGSSLKRISERHS